MKTLYLSDLDGTLLRPDERVSDYTVSVLNRLAERGVVFSYATARSFATAGEIMKECRVSNPVIVHNGAFIVDGASGQFLHCNVLNRSEAAEIYAAFIRNGLRPIVYSVIDSRNRFSYFKNGNSKAQNDFLQTRIGERDLLRRARVIGDDAQALDGDVFYFSCIDDPVRLERVKEALTDKYRCFYSRDIYSGEYWLEVLSKEASKAAAAQKLKEMLGCDRLVCFGDGLNDEILFSVAEERYAVENAATSLKKIADEVIAANTEDGVAHWLERRLLCGRKSI